MGAHFTKSEEHSTISPMWGFYLGLLIVCLLFQILGILGLARYVCKIIRKCCGRRTAERVIRSHVVVVVPCYLPNEEKIIKGTIEHILRQTCGVEKLDLYVVYNTPHEMQEVEAELQNMAGQQWPEGRRLFVERVRESTSKAANLNHIIPSLQSDYIVIYDADHLPDPRSLALSINHLMDNSLDCVQGSTYIRQGCCFLRCVVHAEFFATYFITLPIMSEVTGLAFFGGSNAVWATSSLQKLQFDHNMLTEDIDVSVRAIVHQQLSFGFLPESRSGELAPAGLRALWKQRLRWAIGWDQVTFRYTPHLFGLPWRKRLAMYYVFICRWLMLSCSCVAVLFNVSHAVACLLNKESKSVQPAIISEVQLMSGRLFLCHIVFAYFQMLRHEPRIFLLLGLTLYFWLLPMILLLNTAVLLTSLMNITLGRSTPWVVTSRASADASGEAWIPYSGLRGAWWVLSIALFLMGGLCGALIGRFLGMRTVVRNPLLAAWDFIISGGSPTYLTIVDGRLVALGCMIGMLVGLLLFFMLFCLYKRKHRSAARHDQESVISMSESRDDVTLRAGGN